MPGEYLASRSPYLAVQGLDWFGLNFSCWSWVDFILASRTQCGFLGCRICRLQVLFTFILILKVKHILSYRYCMSFVKLVGHSLPVTYNEPGVRASCQTPIKVFIT